jgi:hypothetical protein
VYASAANQIRLEFDAGGAGVQQDNWNCAGAITADTTYLMEVLYTAAFVRLYVDHVVQAEIIAPVTFTTIPTILYWGLLQAGNQQVDAVFAGV